MLKMLILFRNKKRFYSKSILGLPDGGKLIITEIGTLSSNAKTIRLSSEVRKNVY